MEFSHNDIQYKNIQKLESKFLDRKTDELFLKMLNEIDK